MSLLGSRALLFILLFLCMVPAAQAQPSGAVGQVVLVGEAAESSWRRLVIREEVFETGGAPYDLVEAWSEPWLSSFRLAVIRSRWMERSEGYGTCSQETLDLQQLVAGGREYLATLEWTNAINYLERARLTWVCDRTPPAQQDVADVNFLIGVAMYSQGRLFGASQAWAVALSTGVEPMGVTSWSPELRESYYGTSLDPARVDRLPLEMDKKALAGMTLWVDGQAAGEAFEITAGPHLIQLIDERGAVVASEVVAIASEGQGMDLPGDLFDTVTKQELLHYLRRDVLDERLGGGLKEALAQRAQEQDFEWIIVVAVDEDRAEGVSVTVDGYGDTTSRRRKLRGAAMQRVGKVIPPVLTIGFAACAVASGFSYAESYQVLQSEFFANQDAVDAFTQSAYTVGYIGVGCATASLGSAIMWKINRRKKAKEVFSVEAPDRFYLAISPRSIGLGGTF